VRWSASYRLAGKTDRATARLHETHDALEGGAFADTVASEQADHLAPAYLERHSIQDVALAVVGVQVLDFHEELD
jgi:hypothetical protein